MVLRVLVLEIGGWDRDGFPSFLASQSAFPVGPGPLSDSVSPKI